MRSNHGSNKAIMINGIKYISISEAARSLNTTRHKVYYRLDNNRVGYKYIN